MTPGKFAELLGWATCVREHRLEIPLDRGIDTAKLELTKLALSRSNGVPPEKIYLKKLPGGELPAIVVGPLLGQPATMAAKLETLVSSRAAELLGGAKIPAAVVRRWVEGNGGAAPAADASSDASSPQPAVPDGTAPPRLADVDRSTFISRACAAAARVAGGLGPGVSPLGDKVLVSHVWRRYQQDHGPVPLDAFKQRLSEANGEQLPLVREDLVPEDRRAEFAESEVRTGVSVFHYVRVHSLGVRHAAV